MCLILDANRFSEALRDPPDQRYAPIFEWLEGPGILVIGGTKYRNEVAAHGKASRFFRVLIQAGRAYSEDDTKVDEIEARLVADSACASDDEHIIACAQVAGVRAICTEDTELMDDFTNSKLLNRPRGRVYRNASHAHLLCHGKCCKRGPSSGRRSGGKKRRA